MPAVTPTLQGHLSSKVMGMSIADRNCSLDSFSSDPETAHNKGATAFLDQVESGCRELEALASAVSFEQLVLDMLELNVDKKLPTSTDIHDVLAANSWDAKQVSMVNGMVCEIRPRNPFPMEY